MENLHEYVYPCILSIEYDGNRQTWPCDEIVSVVDNGQLQEIRIPKDSQK